MNDNAIMSTISKLHFFIINIFSFIILTSIFISIILQNGLYVYDISFENIKVKQLYIKWDEKLTITAKELEIKERKDDTPFDVQLKKIVKILKNTLLYKDYFKEIKVEKIIYKNMLGSFDYTQNSNGFFNIESNDFAFKSSISSQNNILDLNILELTNKKDDLKIAGHVIFDTNKEKMEFTSNLSIDINKNSVAKLLLRGDALKLSYRVIAKNEIQNAKKLVELFKLDKDIKFWVYDAINLTSLDIKDFHGWFYYKNMQRAYKNIYAKAVANNLIYTYDTKLSPIKSSHTDLEFKDGVLYIKPQNSYSYNFFLDKSWLKIDFTKKEEILSLYLLFKGKANGDILYLLNHYGIKLPFIQTKGEVDTNLSLDINLITLDVSALGKLFVKNGQINFLGYDIDTQNAEIFIKDSSVKIKNMQTKYKDITSSFVDLEFDGKNSSGFLNFKFDDISFKEYDLVLAKEKKPLMATYTITPKGDFLDIQNSTWIAKDETIKVDALKIPIDLNSTTTKIPRTFIKIENLASGFAKGVVDFKAKKATLEMDSLKSTNKDIVLKNQKTALKIVHDKKTTLICQEAVEVDFFGKNMVVKNFNLEVLDKKISLKNIEVEVLEKLKSTFSAKYDFSNLTGTAVVSSLSLVEKNIGEIFKNSKDLELLIENKNGTLKIESPEHKALYTQNENGKKLKLNALDKVAKESKFAQKYSLTNGNLTLYKRDSDENVKFFATTNYKYKFLINNKTAVKSYTIGGEYDSKNETLNAKINSLADVIIGKNVKIDAKNIDISFDETMKFIHSLGTKNREPIQTNEHGMDVFLNAKDSTIFLDENRSIISDLLEIKYTDKILTTKLKHKNGHAKFYLINDTFNLQGDGFDDEFIEKLSTISKFKNATLDFSISGNIQEYGGLLHIKNSVLTEHKVLNNVLAFVNTIPSLVTFSLPGYSSNGLEVADGYMNFKFKNDIYKISDIYLKSKELEITGFGEVDLEKNSIDLDLNLKTDIGSKISQIPVIGYILFDKNGISTTLKVTGTPENPKVETQIAKEIMVAPLNIIKRTLLYPFKIFD